MCPLIFHVHATYKISRFLHKRFLSFSPAKYYGQTDGRTDGRTDGQAQTNMPPQLLRSWGHKMMANLSQCYPNAFYDII